MQNEKLKMKNENVLDKWILSKLNQLIATVTSSLEKYDAMAASLAIEAFVTDLSQWYIRRSRNRVGRRLMLRWIKTPATKRCMRY